MSEFKNLENAYNVYYENFMNKKKDREEREKKLNEKLTAKLGINCAGVSIIGDYDDNGDPKTFEEYIDWLNKADEREQHKKELEELHKQEQIERQKNNDTKINKFREYLETLPKTYTVKEWRIVVKNLDLKTKPIPRGTKTLNVIKKDSGLELKYIKE